ncbi:MAG: TolC family protein, partial [Acidobacteriota bacterium]
MHVLRIVLCALLLVGASHPIVASSAATDDASIRASITREVHALVGDEDAWTFAPDDADGLLRIDAADRTLIVEPSGLGLQLDARADADTITAVAVVADDLDAFRRLTGRTQVIALVPASSTALDAASADRMRRAAEAIGLSLRVVPVGSDVGAARIIDDLALDADQAARAGVYLAPTVAGEATAIAGALRARDLPAFSGRGRHDVEAGVLAGADRARVQRLARRVALAVLDAVRSEASPAPREAAIGGKAASSSTALVMHHGTRERLGLRLPWAVRLTVELVGAPDPPDADAILTLDDAMRTAIAANLDLTARRLRTAADGEEISRALSALRPRVDLVAQGLTIDEDSAAASFGNQPERVLQATGEASWVLFAEGLRANVDIQRRLQLARTLELEQTRLDIALDAGLAYLDALEAAAFERVERANLTLSRADLDAARDRRAIGAGGPADVARLEARIAQNRQRLVEAHAARRGAELALNQLLARPLDRPLSAPLPDDEDPDGAADVRPLADALTDPQRFDRFRDRHVARALAEAPGIAAADALIAAADRRLLAAQRAFVLPDVSLAGSLTVDLTESGAGTAPPAAGSGAGGPSFPEQPDERWSLALRATLPLYAGGARAVERTQADLDRDALRAQRATVAQRAEQRARAALINLESAYESSRQASEAARAADRAYAVVRDGYAAGRETLTTLLDAQNTARVTRLRATSAVYALRGRWLDLQRAVGGFVALDPDADAFVAQ